ncbi:hypothetical protein ACHWQZ_G007392 [Mnemiopsis leidyi]
MGQHKSKTSQRKIKMPASRDFTPLEGVKDVSTSLHNSATPVLVPSQVDQFDSFTLNTSRSPTVSRQDDYSKCSERSAEMDKIAESHDIAEDKGLIYKNPATEGSITTTTHSNGKVPHPEQPSRDVHTPPVVPVTEGEVLIELSPCLNSHNLKTEDMISTAARNIVEDAIQKAIASEVVSLVICRALGFLLVERATINAHQFLRPESV